MKNILLVVVDTLRPDHLGCYGYDRPTSPHLDDLADKGTVLTSLWSASNFTAPAFTSLFTGLYPHHHGVFDFTAQAKSSPITRLLEDNEVDTAGVVTFRFFGNLLRNIWGEIEAVTDTRSYNFAKSLPFDVTASSLDWLERQGRSERPFCLFVHYDGPHMPFRLPAEHAEAFTSTESAEVEQAVQDQLFPQAERLDDARNKSSMYSFMKAVNWGRRKLDRPTLQWIIDKYDAAVRYNDLAIGKLLAGLQDLGLAEDTIVAVLSDHGEEFLEHGGFAHGGVNLYEEIIRTVGIVYDPARADRGRRIERPVSQVDLMPALLDLAGARNTALSPEAARFAGLLDGSQDAATAADDAVFCHGKFKLAMRCGPHKLIMPKPNPSLSGLARLKAWAYLVLQKKLKTEIFDLAADPQERENLAGDRALRSSLQDKLREHLSSRPRRSLASADLAEAERKRIEQEMKDLGYM